MENSTFNAMTNGKLIEKYMQKFHVEFLREFHEELLKEFR